MNKFSRTTRSVTFAAMCGLALTTGAVGVQATTDFAPAAVAQSVSSPLVDKNAQGTLTLHKKADPRLCIKKQIRAILEPLQVTRIRV